MKTPHTIHKSLRYRGFELFYKEFGLPIYKFVVRKTGGNSDAAEEVCSRTFEAALKGWNSFGHRSTYFTWVCKIALNKLADYYREQIHHNSRIIVPMLEEFSNLEDKNLRPEERLALKELQVAVKDCLLLLPESKRKLLYLRYWEDATMKKLGDFLGVSERAAEGKLYRAKKEFLILFTQRYPDLWGFYQK